RGESVAPRVRRLAKEPHRARVVVDHRLAELARQSGQVHEVAGAQKLVAPVRRNEYAALVAAKALRFDFPARRGLQLAERHPEIVALGLRTIDGHWTIFVNYSHCHRRSLRRGNSRDVRNSASIAFT